MTLGVHLQRLCGPTDKLALVEVLLLGQSLADGEVNPGKALQVVVVEIPVGRIQPVNPSGRLRSNLVGILPVSYTHLDVYKRQDRYHPHELPVVGAGVAETVHQIRIIRADPKFRIIRIRSQNMTFPLSWSDISPTGIAIRPRVCLLYTSRCV